MDLENSQRSYLRSEKAVPIGEVVRRMVNVKARYQDTQDFHERTMLRGEYKYFSGKLCELRAAHTTDLVAFLECVAFFGFGDTVQVDTVMEELSRRCLSLHNSLHVNQLVHLMVCLPTLHKEGSELYHRVAQCLLTVVEQLTAEESVKLCVASTSHTPDDLVLALAPSLVTSVSEFSPPVQVQLLESLGALTIGERSPRFAQAVQPLLRALHSSLTQDLAELHPLDLAVVYAALKTIPCGEELQQAQHTVAMESFIAQASAVCPRALAIFVSVLPAPLSSAAALSQEAQAAGRRALSFAAALGERVVYLSVELTPGELVPVFRLYLHTVVSQRLDEGSKRATSQAQQLIHPLRSLADQLVIALEGAGSFFSSSQLVALLQLWDTSLRVLKEAGETSAFLMTTVPELQRLVPLLRAKIPTATASMTRSELKALLAVSPAVLDKKGEHAVRQALKLCDSA